MTAAASATKAGLLASRRSWRFGVYAGLLMAALAWTWHAGRDLNWDLFNYHLYAGFSVLHDRFGQDFFAAFPAYYNPYAHVPFYALTQTGWSSLAIAGVLTLVHATLLWAVYELALRVRPQTTQRYDQGLAIGAALLALLNPVYLLELGTSFVDVSTGVPVVFAWLAMAWAVSSGRVLALSLAGLLMGVATGLKLSNAIFAIATVPALVWMPGSWLLKLRGVLAFCAVCGLAFVVVAAPWAWRLYQEFGNPFFPMFNGLFHSPDFVLDGAALDRFLPRSMLDALTLPVRMVMPITLVHVETASPDVRYLALLLLAGGFAVRALRRPGAVRAGHAGAARPLAYEATRDPAPDRVLVSLTVIFLLSWGLWLLTSGNSRYFIPAGSLVGVLLIGWLPRLFRARHADRVLVLCSLVLLVQAVQVVVAAAPRFAGAPWTQRWIETDVPDRLRQEPHFYLTLQAQSHAFLAPEFHPESGFFNAAGGFTFDPSGPGSARAKRLMQRFEGRMRMLIGLDATNASGQYLLPDFSQIDDRVLPWGYRVDPDDCESIGLAAGLPTLALTIDTNVGSTVPGPILTCRLVRASEAERLAHEADRRRIEPVFAHLESACPDLFKPVGLLAEGGGKRWQKAYSATDTRAYVSNGRVSYFSAVRGGDPVAVGRVEDWLAGPQPIDCSRRAAAAFGGLGH